MKKASKKNDRAQQRIILSTPPENRKMTRTVRVELEIRNTQKGNRIKRKRREQRMQNKSERKSERTYLILWIPLLEVTGPHRLHLCSANKHTHTHSYTDTSPALLLALSLSQIIPSRLCHVSSNPIGGKFMLSVLCNLSALRGKFCA